MTVAELIAQLQKLPDQSLPVCLDDWSEEYVDPSEVGTVKLEDGAHYLKAAPDSTGPYVCLGVEYYD
jgi:hypothetical protein